MEVKERDAVPTASRLNPKAIRALQRNLSGIADIPGHIFLILAMGAAVVSCPACSASAADFWMTPLLIFVGIAPAGRGRLGRQPHRGLVVFGCLFLLAPPRHRSGAGRWCFERRRRRHYAWCLDLYAAALARQLDLLIALSYVILLTTVGGLMFWEGLRAIMRVRRGMVVPRMRRSGSHGWIHGLPLKNALQAPPRSICR